MSTRASPTATPTGSSENDASTTDGPLDDSGTRLVSTPPPLGPKEQKKYEFAKSICPVALKEQNGEHFVGCRSCFGYEQPPQDGLIALNPELFYRLEQLVAGSFTKPGATEAAAVFEGCESHAGNYGGTVLARRTDTGWKVMRYESGLHPASCKRYRRSNGRHILVCFWADGHQSFWHHYLFSFDFTRGDKGWVQIVELNDETAAYCVWGKPPKNRITFSSIESFSFSDIDNNGTADLVVDVKHIRAAPTPAYEQKCADLLNSVEAPDGTPPSFEDALGKRRSYRLEYVYDGAKFTPTAKTKKLLEKL